MGMVIICVVFGGIQAGVIFAIRVILLLALPLTIQIPINNGVDWPAKIFGALGLTMIAAGLVPPYIDIYKTRRVRGFSFIFLMIDMGGALFSLLSLCTPRIPIERKLTVTVFQEFDILAAVIYIVRLWYGKP